MVLLGLGKPQNVAPLNEQMAIELGADILGEFLVFSVAAGITIFEFNRSSAKKQREEDALYDRIQRLETALDRLALLTDKQRAQITHLERTVTTPRTWSLPHLKKDAKSTQPPPKQAHCVTLERTDILEEENTRKLQEYSGVTGWLLNSTQTTSPYLNISPGTEEEESARKLVADSLRRDKEDVTVDHIVKS